MPFHITGPYPQTIHDLRLASAQIVHVIMTTTFVVPTLVSEFSSASSNSPFLREELMGISCAKTHIQLFGEGSEIFAGKSVDKRIHEWTDQEIRMMLSWGNFKANAYFISYVCQIMGRFWGGKMTEEQATEEGRYIYTPFR